MKRYVARSTGGNGMTHWYEYWTGSGWSPDITRAVFYSEPNDGFVKTEYFCAYREDRMREFTMVEVELTIKEKA